MFSLWLAYYCFSNEPKRVSNLLSATLKWRIIAGLQRSLDNSPPIDYDDDDSAVGAAAAATTNATTLASSTNEIKIVKANV